MKQQPQVVEIIKEPLELYKILKIGNLVQSGGEAKYVISEKLVRVNGVVETRKGNKIISGDVVEFNDIKLQVRLQKKQK